MKLLGYIFSLMLSLTCYAQSVLPKPEEIPVFIRDDVYEDYLKFLDGRAVLSIVDFRGITMRRDVADMVLLQQALALGGFTKRFYYQPGKFNFRNTKLLETGDSLLSFDTYWLSDAKALSDKVFISEPVVRRGEYLAMVRSINEIAHALGRKTIAEYVETASIRARLLELGVDYVQGYGVEKPRSLEHWLTQQ